MPSSQSLADLNSALLTVCEEFRRGFAKVVDPSRYLVLRAIVRGGGRRPIEVADQLDMLPSSVTRHSQALLEAGLIHVQGNPDDRRSSLLQSTENGARLLAEFDATGVEASRQVLGGWDPAEIDTLTALLLKLSDAWDRQGAAARRPRDIGTNE